MSTSVRVKVTVEDELDTIANDHGGVVKPIDVLEYAKDPDTALHKRFTWDDGDAAERYRLWQAREILHIYVREERSGKPNQNVRVFVSLPSDRKDGGYRQLVRVMSNKKHRKELYEMAIRDLLIFRNNRRYKDLAELQPIWEAIDRVLG